MEQGKTVGPVSPKNSLTIETLQDIWVFLPWSTGQTIWPREFGEKQRHNKKINPVYINYFLKLFINLMNYPFESRYHRKFFSFKRIFTAAGADSAEYGSFC